MDSARAARRERSHRAHSWLTNYGSHFAQHIIFEFSRPPRQNPHYTRIYQSTKQRPISLAAAAPPKAGIELPPNSFWEEEPSTICGLEGRRREA
jgi:hypothetical protein